MMKTEIIIVGAGHGGLVAATKLARSGFQVVVFEKSERNKLSWNWKDCLDLEVFERINLPRPKPFEYETPANFRFFSPNEKNYIDTDVPPEEREKSMERRLLMEKLLMHALDAGVDFYFNREVSGPLLEGNKICGIKVGEEHHYADLIIDSAGFNSPIRPNLPSEYEITSNLADGDYIYAYRGYFNKKQNKRFWDIIIGYKNKRGISWLNTSSKDEADILIGSVHPFEEGEIEALVHDLRIKYPVVGTELLRGGQVELIPIRRSLEKFVGDNYAAVGDVACMTNPINGSGITRSMIAGDILAHNVIKARKNAHNTYTTSILWPYQVEYFREIGAKQGYIEVMKNFLISIDDFSKIDFLFKNKLLAPNDIITNLMGKELNLGVGEMLWRGFRGMKRGDILIELAHTINTADKVKKHYLNIPHYYDRHKFLKWKKQLERYVVKN